MLSFTRIVIALLYVSSQLVPVLLTVKLTVTPQYIIGKLGSKVTLSCLSDNAKWWRKWSPGSTDEQVVTRYQGVTFNFVHCSTSGSYANSGSFNLTIPKLSYTDAGRYQCLDDKGDTQSAELIVTGPDLNCSSSCSNPTSMSCIATYHGNDGILKLNFSLDDDKHTKSLPYNYTLKKSDSSNPLTIFEAHAETESFIYGQTFTCSIATSPETTQAVLNCSKICETAADGNTSIPAVIGGAISGFISLIILLILVGVFFRRRTNQKKQKENPDSEHPNIQHAVENEYGIGLCNGETSKQSDPLFEKPDSDGENIQRAVENETEVNLRGEETGNLLSTNAQSDSHSATPDTDPDHNQNSFGNEKNEIREETQRDKADSEDTQVSTSQEPG